MVPYRIHLTLKAFGYTKSQEEISNELQSLSLRGEFNVLLGREISDEEFNMYQETYREVQTRIRKNYLKPFPGVLDLMGELKRLGVKIGIVSNRRKPSLIEDCSFLGFMEFVDELFPPDVYGGYKPDPVAVLAALKHFNVTNPKRVLFVGDAKPDVQASNASGIDSCIVPYARVPETIDVAPTYWLRSLNDVLLLVKGEIKEELKEKPELKIIGQIPQINEKLEAS
ncbi:putative Haloacid dehalogenase-like hydrolase [Monocercomonoides exilis]|uniref:putative Haloacid dehalogenase-like hydrolase n=1 Tax=Monocercomonoides exilis TaxID=2049356 RepID=UPI003559D966|nr:putative Haloacid dehalogenase-like hydrolase [Monocercomonoides exilis]|eukprot:MONOS_6231.1-p1 / transcript=MONOS_6231.1 / gene=MONOS_6231 / organism=Monocercomonoides_exilis_PA203 / gene_product=Haloacid dehalogenase-like hydrolase / transcript_product=Haloacid dehalogenase-like hydrolase / location=Mono_scaffold00193:78537-79546(+) / protein_length=226 / sequence_SO=supercontig / SO=protein_coding / is_pseudo=false